MYRAKQMSGTLFVVIAVQIKSCMERVLQLPLGSLTKQIRLARDLEELFIVYETK
jgi:hypothetical protein